MVETPGNSKERYERAEAYIKQRLDEVHDKMKIVDDKNHLIWEVSLKEIFAEWMNYLVKSNYKSNDKNNLLNQRFTFVLRRNTDAITDLIKWFFEAKRRYGRDRERWEEWNRQALCKNYCAKYQRYNDEDILHRFFYSYSAAERRIRTNVKEGKLLANTSDSLFNTLQIIKDEDQKKAEEKKRKLEERQRKELEKQHKKEEKELEKAKKAQLKAMKEAEKDTKTTKHQALSSYNTEVHDTKELNSIDEGAANHYWWNDDNIIDDNWDIVPNIEKLNQHHNEDSTEEITYSEGLEDNIYSEKPEDNSHSKISTPKRIKTIKVNPNDLQLFDEDWNPTIEALIEPNNEK